MSDPFHHRTVLVVVVSGPRQYHGTKCHPPPYHNILPVVIVVRRNFRIDPTCIHPVWVVVSPSFASKKVRNPSMVMTLWMTYRMTQPVHGRIPNMNRMYSITYRSRIPVILLGWYRMIPDLVRGRSNHYHSYKYIQRRPRNPTMMSRIPHRSHRKIQPRSYIRTMI